MQLHFKKFLFLFYFLPRFADVVNRWVLEKESVEKKWGSGRGIYILKHKEMVWRNTYTVFSISTKEKKKGLVEPILPSVSALPVLTGEGLARPFFISRKDFSFQK